MTTTLQHTRAHTKWCSCFWDVSLMGHFLEAHPYINQRNWGHRGSSSASLTGLQDLFVYRPRASAWGRFDPWSTTHSHDLLTCENDEGNNPLPPKNNTQRGETLVQPRICARARSHRMTAGVITVWIRSQEASLSGAELQPLQMAGDAAVRTRTNLPKSASTNDFDRFVTRDHSRTVRRVHERTMAHIRAG